MAFTIEKPKLDIGETPIENIFINNFLNLADEIQLKVYIAGQYVAMNPCKNCGIKEIAYLLSIDTTELKNALIFWKGLGVIDFDEKIAETTDDFDVKFISLRQTYLNSNFIPKSSNSFIIDKNSNHILKDKKMLDLFEDCEELMSKPLTPDERLKIVEWIKEFNMSTEMILRAIKITFVQNPPGKPSLKYVKGILSKWAGNKIHDIKSAKEHEKKFNKRAEFYKSVNARLSGKSSLPTESQINIIEDWAKKCESENCFFAVIDNCSSAYVYPSYKNLESLFKKISKNHSLTSDGILEYFREDENKKSDARSNSKKGKAKAKIENFAQDKYKNMTKEDGIKSMRKNNPLLKS